MGSLFFSSNGGSVTPHQDKGGSQGPSLGGWLANDDKGQQSPLFQSFGSVRDRTGTPGTSLEPRTPAGTLQQDGAIMPRSEPRSSSKSYSLFSHDISTPHRRGDTPGRSLVTSTPGPPSTSLWGRSPSHGTSSMPPPPPCETLGDYLDRSPELGTPIPSTTAASPPDGTLLSPTSSFRSRGGWPSNGSPGFGSGGAVGPSFGAGGSNLGSGMVNNGAPMSWEGSSQQGGWLTSPRGTPSAWATPSGPAERSPLVDSPVAGVMIQGSNDGLMTVPPPQESVRPSNAGFMRARAGGDGEDRWVTVFGFGPDDVNTVMREFENCGTLVNHVYGPGGTNWIHIEYQSKFEAQKALSKNGTQLSSSLIIGVKLLDYHQRPLVMDMTRSASIGPSAGSLSVGKGTNRPGSASLAAARPYHLEPRAASGQGVGIAQPAKSTLTKVWDFIFGV